MTSPRPLSTFENLTGALKRRRNAVLRTLGSLLAVVVCGYFSLGTSCYDLHADASTTVHFGAGQSRAVLLVRAQGTTLRLEFDEALTVLRDGATTGFAGAVEAESGAAGAAGAESGAAGTSDTLARVCEANQDSATSHWTVCHTYDVPDEAVRYELIRSDTEGALDVNVQASASVGCESNQAVGVDLEIEEPS